MERVDWVPMRGLQFCVLGFRFTGKTELYVIHEAVEMDIEFMKNVAKGNKGR